MIYNVARTAENTMLVRGANTYKQRIMHFLEGFGFMPRDAHVLEDDGIEIKHVDGVFRDVSRLFVREFSHIKVLWPIAHYRPHAPRGSRPGVPAG